ncbi:MULTISPECIES: tetratricopeptide repeat protein [unclassified Corallococcus]|uniref:tetratricopeptide repeat protein n=1 Tax=unclassified Corallococcus TaxID=2685029 RepID=UPI001A8E42D3|nr:tetratricopeptide repeat protein [Corallococcus sp. NCRR]MBN9687345.1 tetratricopeptide repeat protein [Corallococcus sp. NCSPR001]WAS88833.1 tetratricopeptide repeat protein [Corallococcus sp. NCRR]
MTATLHALALALSLGAAPAPAPQAPKPGAPLPPMPASLSSRAASVEAVEAQLRTAEQSLRFVETQFTERPEPSSTDSQLKRFSEGEVYSLLGDWAAASVLFYDLVSDPAFKANPRYPEAVFYLADALYQQKNDIGARVYLRDVLDLPLTPQRYKEAVSRYLAVAGRLQQFDGIDTYVEKARQLSGGVLAPDIAYVHARGTFKRMDLTPEEHQQRSRALFAPLAQGPGAFRVQAVYHLGVLSVQSGDYPAAIAEFQRIVGTGPEAVVSTGLPEAEAQRFRELAFLSLGRLMYETGRYDEALDHYGQIPRESERFPESLLEVAWTYVRKQDFTQAKNATDILLLVAPDSQLAPEARILQGHLLQKLRQYDEALETYDGVANTFRPARDKVDALLRVNQDPVAYFDNLLARNERSLDVSTLLPPLALKYASTQKEVADAVRMVGDLDSGRQGAGEAKAIAERILEALDARGLEAFPELQEGYVRTEAVDTALTAVEQSLVQAEAELVEEKLTPAEREKLLVAQGAREAQRLRFAALPTTNKELEERRHRMQAKVDAVDREAFRVGYELQSLHANAAAIRKWVEDTRDERQADPAEEREFLVQLQAEIAALKDLQAELDRTRARLASERQSTDTSLEGEAAIRARYSAALQQEHGVLRAGEGRLSGEDTRVLLRMHAVRSRIDSLRGRVAIARVALRSRLENRVKSIRDKVRVEQALLQGYEQEVAAASGDARNLVGRIAYESFRRVRQQFYDLVLKADTGTVDVAFSRTQDNAANIQKVAKEKSDALRALDLEFKDVLSSEGGD